MNDFSSNPGYKCLGKRISLTVVHWGTKEKKKEIRDIKHQRRKKKKENNKLWACFAFFFKSEAFVVPVAAGSSAWTASLLCHGETGLSELKRRDNT